MAVLFFSDGGDATGGTQTLDEIGAGVTVQTSQVHTGTRAFLCDTGGAAASSYLARYNVAGLTRRMTAWVHFRDLASAHNPIWMVLSTTAWLFGVAVDSSNQIRLMVNGAGSGSYLGAVGPTVTTGIWYRLSVAWSIVSTTSWTYRIWLDGVLVGTVTNADVTLADTSPLHSYWGYLTATSGSANPNIGLYLDDMVWDDGGGLDDIGDVRLYRQPYSAPVTNTFGTEIDTGALLPPVPRAAHLSQVPINQAQGWQSGTAAQEETYTIAAQGVVTPSMATVVAWQSWVWADMTTGTVRTVTLHENGAGRTITLVANTPAEYRSALTTTGTYPTGKFGLQRATGTGMTVRFYEGSVSVAARLPVSAAVLSGSGAGLATGAATALALPQALAGSGTSVATATALRIALPHAITASGAGAASGSATQLVGAAAVLAASGTGTATGTAASIAQTQPLAGSATGASMGTGTTLALPRSLGASGAGTAAGSGTTLALVGVLAASGGGVSAGAVSTLALPHAVAGSGTGAGSSTATALTLSQPLAASGSGAATATADLTVPGGAAVLAASGAGTATSTALALQFAALPLTGSGAGTAASAALRLTLAQPLMASGAGVAVFTVLTLRQTQPLAATGAGTATGAADLTQAGAGAQLSATGAGSATATATTVRLAHALTAAGVGVATGTGTSLRLAAHPLVASGAGVATATADLFVGSAGAVLAATGTGQATVQASTLSLAHALTGSGAGLATSAATSIALTPAIAGTVAGLSTAQASGLVILSGSPLAARGDGLSAGLADLVVYVPRAPGTVTPGIRGRGMTTAVRDLGMVGGTVGGRGSPAGVQTYGRGMTTAVTDVGSVTIAP